MGKIKSLTLLVCAVTSLSLLSSNSYAASKPTNTATVKIVNGKTTTTTTYTTTPVPTPASVTTSQTIATPYSSPTSAIFQVNSAIPGSPSSSNTVIKKSSTTAVTTTINGKTNTPPTVQTLPLAIYGQPVCDPVKYISCDHNNPPPTVSYSNGIIMWNSSKQITNGSPSTIYDQNGKVIPTNPSFTGTSTCLPTTENIKTVNGTYSYPNIPYGQYWNDTIITGHPTWTWDQIQVITTTYLVSGYLMGSKGGQGGTIFAPKTSIVTKNATTGGWTAGSPIARNTVWGSCTYPPRGLPQRQDCVWTIGGISFDGPYGNGATAPGSLGSLATPPFPGSINTSVFASPFNDKFNASISSSSELLALVKFGSSANPACTSRYSKSFDWKIPDNGHGVWNIKADVHYVPCAYIDFPKDTINNKAGYSIFLNCLKPNAYKAQVYLKQYIGCDGIPRAWTATQNGKDFNPSLCPKTTNNSSIKVDTIIPSLICDSTPGTAIPASTKANPSPIFVSNNSQMQADGNIWMLHWNLPTINLASNIVLGSESNKRTAFMIDSNSSPYDSSLLATDISQPVKSNPSLATGTWNAVLDPSNIETDTSSVANWNTDAQLQVYKASDSGKKLTVWKRQWFDALYTTKTSTFHALDLSVPPVITTTESKGTFYCDTGKRSFTVVQGRNTSKH